MADPEKLDMDKMDEVYKKWEARSSGPSSGGNYRAGFTNDTQQSAWQRDNLQGPIRQPSKYRARKRKPKVGVKYTNLSSIDKSE